MPTVQTAIMIRLMVYTTSLARFCSPAIRRLIHWELVAIPVRMRQAMYNVYTSYEMTSYEVVSGTRMVRVSSEAVMR